MSKNVKTIAFYLTQFHPIAENNEWWGKGFTEWTNVTKAESLYDGHYQPHLPADFGFYDLRLREIRHEQIKLAKKFGIEGFCYHYYWFSGKRLLEKPFNDMLADSGSDMPFCICWANENWTRRWDGAEHQVLIAQGYRDEDDLNFIKDLIPVIKDPRYIRLDGAPFIIVYMPQQLPDAKKTLTVWRNYARSMGIENLHFCAALTDENKDYHQFGFDSGIDFPPHNLDDIDILNNKLNFKKKFFGNIVSYESIAKFYLARKTENQRIFKTVFPSWDNTARRGERALIVPNGTPSNYEYWLSQSIQLTKENNNDVESFVFINAWNEWAEGCHLEPDRKYGHQFLEATLRAVSNTSNLKDFPDKFTLQMEKRYFLTDISNVTSYHLHVFQKQLYLHTKTILKKVLPTQIKTKLKLFKAKMNKKIGK
jgi:lipopolysaccharide biosynthesis protein